jgi:8-oxo-dGTP pyrophosphatase MutT (NUDIX family)
VPPVHFLSDTSPLDGDDATAALIVTGDGRYLLQLRDDNPGIFYPGHWGCFGGAVAAGETPLRALQRELEEELEFHSAPLRDFTRFDFDLRGIGSQRKLYRTYFEVTVTEEMTSRFVLHEGAGMRLFTPSEIFDRANITPYDAFALWLYIARKRFR